jgi:ABC-type nitrate/sulfonate/bicarbonate transport system substrate-binding protein
LNALSANAIDALFAYEPTTTLARDSKEFRVLYPSVYATLLDPSPLGGAVVARSFERTLPLLAVQTITVFDEAVRFVRANPHKARALIPKFMPVSRDTAERITLVESGLSSEVNVRNLQQMINLLHEAGEIPTVVAAKSLVAQDANE